ncbi:hypothetical protein O9A_01440 [Bartonella koehlerae C-29]|uniref:Uncharacterized protein n=1 Tax=Bartonella koehlerae C-29 TaxID=1134510 RepID=A0A067W2M1_9HYPH|nr:hypothetical protein O9A_01440 [Bartonella koehlerae C-29]
MTSKDFAFFAQNVIGICLCTDALFRFSDGVFDEMCTITPNTLSWRNLSKMTGAKR